MSERVGTAQKRLVERILELKAQPRVSKHASLVRAVVLAIDERELQRGSPLPSVNELSNQTGYARQTIVKAYNELKQRGLIEAKSRRGFFVHTENTFQMMRVALVLYAFQAFQESFYNTFREALGPEIQVDTFFHHNNVDVLADIISKVNGHYGVYVIAPIELPRVAKLLEALPTGRVLVVDRPPPEDSDLPYLSQQFEEPTFRIFQSIKKALGRYERMVTYYDESSDVPPGIVAGMQRFADSHDLPLTIDKSYRKGSVRPKTCYVTIRDSDLWPLLEDAVNENLELGCDLGVISHNDSPVKRVLRGGITTITTDFDDMARAAARFVTHQERPRRTLPTRVIERSSLHCESSHNVNS